MKKLTCLLLSFLMLFSLVSCEGAGNKKQDESPITMYIPLGNGEQYYRTLQEMLLEDLGIEVEFVYQINCNTTSMTELCFKNNDLPADIVFTASKMNDDLLKDSCVDLLSRSSITERFTPTTIQNCTTEDGAIYQLPISSKLIGITYNETLLKEMGWEVPLTFEDMLDLKEKCDEAGIRFAVTDGCATGHGFNWLFHLMGTDWLSTPEGTEWFEGFQAGTRSVDEFKEACEYFRKWTEAGLFGSIYNTDWSGGVEFAKTRALFWFGLTNSSTGYQGMQYDADGNETGIMLDDTFKALPWISENGSNNCFTYYDNSWVYVNKDLEAPEKSEKLKKALQIVEYLVSDRATALVSSISKDTYVSVNNYTIGEDRIYAAFNEEIKNGFVQPWYYNSFDADSINLTGDVVNKYLLGEADFDEIFTTLDECNQLHLQNEIDVLADFPEKLGFEDTAKLAALATGTALDLMLREDGRSETTGVVLMPYTTEKNQLPPWRSASVVNSIVFPGKLDKAHGNTIFAPNTSVPSAIRMTGAEIKALTEKKFDPSDRFINAETGECSFDAENYGPYPYVCLVKGGESLEDDREYLVAVCEKCLSAADFNAFSEAGKVLSLENSVTLTQGLISYCETRDSITAADLVWK